MSARVVLICALSFVAFAFTSFVYAVVRRVRKTRREWARLAYQKQLAHTQDVADEAEQTILFI